MKKEKNKKTIQIDIETLPLDIPDHVLDSMRYVHQQMNYMSGLISNAEKEDAADKIWMTKTGQRIEYKDLEDDHLNKILSMYKQGKFKNRLCHLKGLKQEKLKRSTKSGAILYGN